MARPRVLVLRAPGTNCDEETAFAFERAGGVADRVHVNRLLEKTALVDEFQILCFPGGFSYGDDVAAGRILGSILRHHLGPALTRFRDRGGLILGICNGFQILIKSGLLLNDVPEEVPPATLTWNAHGRYEDRWVHLTVEKSRAVFFAGIERMYLPIAHAEGRFVARDAAALAALEEAGQVVLRYSPAPDRAASSASPGSPLSFPENPNGSAANIAAICDATGRVCGLMPHPERHLIRTQHPSWTRFTAPDEVDCPGDGMKVFQNAVGYFV